MAVDELNESARASGSRPREKWIAVYIAVLAVFLAVASLSGDNVAKDAANANIDAANLWAFFQAKNLRRTHYMVALEGLEVRLAERPAPATRALIEAKIADYRARIARYTSDKERMEGLDELFVRAKAVEQRRDDLLQRDPYFDYAQALIQIAIVLASVAIIAGGTLSISLSVLTALAGLLMLANGFTLAVDLDLLMQADWSDIRDFMTFQARPAGVPPPQ
jgi:hypothetical protein